MRLCFAAGIAFGLATAAHAQNLVPDPAFRFGTGAWTGSSLSGNFTMTFVPGVSARPGSGSALLNVDSPAAGTYSVCIGVAGGRTYEWGYSIFFPDASRTTGLVELLAGYDGPSCTGSIVGGYILQIVPGSVGSWHGGTAFSFPAPASCRSILAGFATPGIGAPGLAGTAYVDDVFLAQAGTVPPIEPPDPIPSLSTLGVVALGAALALAGARVLEARA